MSKVYSEFIKLTNEKFRGPMIDNSWYAAVQRNGKPYFPALIMLADAVYWSTPTVIFNENTNRIVGYKNKCVKKFLLRDATDYEISFGLTKTQVRDARAILTKLKLIKLEDNYIKTKRDKVILAGYFTIPNVVNIIALKDKKSEYNSTTGVESVEQGVESVDSRVGSVDSLTKVHTKVHTKKLSSKEDKKNQKTDSSKTPVKTNLANLRNKFKTKRKEPCTIKFLFPKSKLKDLDSILVKLENLGAQKHRRDTKIYKTTLNNIYSLLTPKKKNPYLEKLNKADSEIYESKLWTEDELLETFKNRIGKSPKTVSAFIINPHNGYSWLIATHKQFNKILTVSELGQKVMNEFSKLEAKDAIKVDEFLQTLDSKYKVNQELYSTYRGSILKVFINFAKDKVNDAKFKIHSLGQPWLQEEFLNTRIGYTLQEK